MDIWDYDIIKIKNRNATVNHVPGTIGLRLISPFAETMIPR